MIFAEINTIQTICEVERTQKLIILALSVKSPQSAGFLPTQNCSNVLYVYSYSVWLYDCPHHLSPLIVLQNNVTMKSLLNVLTLLCL